MADLKKRLKSIASLEEVNDKTIEKIGTAQKAIATRQSDIPNQVGVNIPNQVGAKIRNRGI